MVCNRYCQTFDRIFEKKKRDFISIININQEVFFFLPFFKFYSCLGKRHIHDSNCLFSCAEPSPGVLVLTPGRELIMTCKGHVTVDGLKVRNGSKPGGRDGSDVNGGNTENRSSGHAASPTAHAAPLTSVHRPSVDQETEKEEWSDGSRGRRGENSSLQWKWTGRMVRKRDQDVKWSRGATLSLPSVTEADSGTFTCYHRDKEMFSLKVIVAGESHTLCAYTCACGLSSTP